MQNKTQLENLFKKSGCDDFKWIDSSSIVVAQWVRMKCLFGCPAYGKSLACPPNTPSIADCRQFFNEYEHCVIFHFTLQVAKPEDRFPWNKETNKMLLEIEREVFLSGYHKAFVLLVNECSICLECTTSREECKQPETLRPVPESMGVDLFGTVRSAGYPLEVLKDYSQEMNRYALLMVE